MTDHAGGHWLDTGDGPKSLTDAVVNVRENGAQAAYRTYLDHRPECPQCQQSTFICDTAKGLWSAYVEARKRTV